MDKNKNVKVDKEKNHYICDILHMDSAAYYIAMNAQDFQDFFRQRLIDLYPNLCEEHDIQPMELTGMAKSMYIEHKKQYERYIEVQEKKASRGKGGIENQR
ncbi:MAG: hypothetical protein FWG64_01775 [Firmicutes bacterium]|nr:hypothetical protein [Bacillota bacterium]